MLIILFGLTGSGKNFVGELLQSHFGYYYWDGDAALSTEMKLAIRNKLEFTQAMRDQLAKAIINKAHTLSKTYPNIVISQALYKEKNRQQIIKAFPNAVFIHVQTDLSLALSRIKARNNQINSEYAALINQHFEPPILQYERLENNKSAFEVIKQLKVILNKK